jgi:hypothetical protein
MQNIETSPSENQALCDLKMELREEQVETVTASSSS